MEIKSSAFKNFGSIPEKYTCEGLDINPPLELVDVPPEAISLVLIMDDPDVPAHIRKDQMYVHWVIYDIPPSTRHVPENSTPPGTLGMGTNQAMLYKGPCPPDREHRYFFKLYALNTKLNIEAGATKDKIEQLIQPHIIAKAELVGLYCKKANR